MNFFKVIALAFAVVSAVTVVHAEEDTLECPLICPHLFAPTCATNGNEFVQFNNPCALKAFNCNRQRSTSAPYSKTDIDWCTTTELNEADFASDLEKADTSCIRPCPMIYRPVCGSNGTYRKMFSNACQMNTFSCLYKANSKNTWRLLKQGKCSQNADEE